MSLVSDLKNVDSNFSITLISLFISIVAPGVLTIYLFLPELFKDLDGVKFLLFSVSLSLPLFVMNCISIIFLDNSPSTPGHQDVAIFSGIMSSFCMFSSLLVAYIFSLPFEKFLICVVLIEVCLLVLFGLLERAHNRG